MTLNLAGKRAAIVTDNELLSRAIELSLSDRLQMQTKDLSSGSFPWPDAEEGDSSLDLIVVAMSGSGGGSLLAGVRASLARHFGRVPILIISDRRLESPPQGSVHLDFPFHPDELQDRVAGLLTRA
jgi:DNA-binding response OmpR family regulator